MTGNDTPPIAAGPPWPLELLADLHAGVFDPADAAELHARIATDPEASAILAALDATVADLSALPPLRIPDDVAARLDAALQAEATTRGGPPETQHDTPHGARPPAPPVEGQPPAIAPQTTGPHATAPQIAGPPLTAGPQTAGQPPIPGPPAAGRTHAAGAPAVLDLAAARERRRRRTLAAGAGLLTAAAAIIGVIAVAGLTGGQTTGTPKAGPTNASDPTLPPLVLSPGDLGAALDDTLSVRDYGSLAAAGRLDACLAANRLDPATAKPLGAREVTLEGKSGVLLILPTGTAARYRLLVVAPDCGPGNAAVLADTTVGR